MAPRSHASPWSPITPTHQRSPSHARWAVRSEEKRLVRVRVRVRVRARVRVRVTIRVTIRVGVRVRVGLEVEGTLRHAPSPYGDAQARLVGGGVVVERRGGEAARVEVGAAGAL